ncbi:hypothetical protein vBRpoSV10_197 [Ruegeria phage vB_RpoS-V10]|nr:hypothetical protein DSS3P8_192 [Roseobacter phage DSS3P8]AWY09319.1 hypothetical protein vBRpoSV10_197 [Ruegeria phage vB_RpoS-V10]
MTFKVVYAAAHSHLARACGTGENGCFIVQRDHNLLTGRPIPRPVLAIDVGFMSGAQAQEWADRQYVTPMNQREIAA